MLTSAGHARLHAHQALGSTLTWRCIKRRTSGGDKVEAFLTGPGGAVFPVAIKDLGNGCYTLSSATNRPGPWVIKPLVLA